MTLVAHLPNRAVLAVSGPDRVSYLQGLVSNDVTAASAVRAVWAALLTPQGKWLADFFITSDGERLLLDVEAAQAAMLVQRLMRFRLRAQVRVEALDLPVYVGWGDGPAPEGAAPDPRLPEAGWRLLGAAVASAGPEAYDAHRIALGLPDGSRDMEAEKTTLLEAGFDELNGVSWTKGCYMGQELTARTKYRGLVKRRLVPVFATTMPRPGSPVTADGIDVGTMRSGSGGAGLALLRIDALNRELLSDGETLRPSVPAWMALSPAAVPA